MQRSSFARIVLGILLIAGARPAAAQFAEVHNGAAAPICCAWNPYGVGWYYTPSSSFVLTGIETRFGLADGFTYAARTVTAEVRTTLNGAVLGSVSFSTSASAADWVGGSFSGVPLIAGTTYFIDWLNVGRIGATYLGTNAVSGAPSGDWGAFYYASDPGPFNGTTTGFDPIVRLSGSTDVVPEPATMTLLATGLAGMAAARRRKRLG